MDMELGPLPASAEGGQTSSRTEQQLYHLVQREFSSRNATSRQQARIPNEPKFKRAPTGTTRDDDNTLARLGAATITGTTPGSARPRTAAGQPKSLLPVTERKSQEEYVPRKKSTKGSQDEGKEKWDIAPDGGSAGREGRQFAVWNVGNNGRIYLRPSVRPANQRYPQPQFVFPMTPPGTAELDTLAPAKDKGTTGGDTPTPYTENQLTPSYLSSTPSNSYLGVKKAGNVPGSRHRRALSDSTMPDNNSNNNNNNNNNIARESDPGGFKIVITQPGEDQRPRTVGNTDPGKGSLLEVVIPSWKLGTPRFSVRGTPFIRGSSYAPTVAEDARYSSTSLINHTPRAFLTPQDSGYSQAQRPQLPTDPVSSPGFSTLSQFPLPPRIGFLSSTTTIEPAMFDVLTFKPACDDRSLVRYSPSTGAVTAASPPRLVAEITSPSFCDYDLISDFFLTYRTFLDRSDLLCMLVARLRWALAQTDKEIGTVVRVRTFVAIRHWILNYFLEDFLPDFSLRVTFCGLLNGFVEEVSDKPISNKAWLKILLELKRCWRRVCAQYWDSAEGDVSDGPDEPISPGGIAGHRDSKLDPTFWDRIESRPPQLDGALVRQATHDSVGFYVDVAPAGQDQIDTMMLGERPTTPENQRIEEIEGNPASPVSQASIDVVSCSFPTKNMRSAPHAFQNPLAAHPVDPSSVYTRSPEPVATTPRALVGKRVRAQPQSPPQPQHKRNGSLSDSLREHGTPTEKLLYRNAEFLLKLPYAGGGGLVRGTVLPPGQAFVHVAQPGDDGAQSRQTTVFERYPTETSKFRLPASAMSGQGMRRLLGSVRRALSTRGDSISTVQGNFMNIPPVGPRGATTNRLPGTAIVPQARPRLNGIRPPVRIDLLAAEIAEDFKRAVREDAEETERQRGRSTTASIPEEEPTLERADYSAAHMDRGIVSRQVSDMAITTGSKSIVIVDDTVPGDFPAMSGALMPASNASVEAFGETFMPNLAGPTPPNTPPERPVDTPRRDSYILSQQVISPSLSDDAPLPPFVPDLKTLGRVESSAPRPSQDTTRSSVDFLHQTPNRPPLSGRRGRGHLRHPSNRSHRSNRSLHRPRYASFTSGILPQPILRSIRSFDATTLSEGSILDVDTISDAPMPQPLRVLRRRPGGDLRANTRVGDLDPGLLRRSRSVGSLSTFDDSLPGSYIHNAVPDSSSFMDVAISDHPNEKVKPFSVGAITEQTPKKALSLFSTHSSKPIMRPSFEVEAQKLAQIPDDIYDDGGVEAALMKLEGKYEKKSQAPRLTIELQPPKTAVSGPPASIYIPEQDVEVSKQEKIEHRHVQVEDEHLIAAPPPLSAAGTPVASLLSMPAVRNGREDVQSFLLDDSRGSYSSTPLLDRGMSDDGHSRRTTTAEWTNRSILQDPEDDVATPTKRNMNSSHPSYDFVQKTGSMEKIIPGETMPANTATTDPRQSTELSFLDVDSDDDTDLSSEMSLEFIGSNDEDGLFPPLKESAVASTLPVNPLGGNPPITRFDSHSSHELELPPTALGQVLHKGPSSTISIPMVHEHQLWGEKPLPPTPDTTPRTVIAPFHSHSFGSSDPTGTKQALRHAPTLDIADPVSRITSAPRNKYSVHLPFILAFDSEVLAQQFTLVEKDALNEIDWKDLIDMKWKKAEQSGTNTRSWVSFLRDTDARGVEVVIARFNIVVKWAVSECVLTQDLEERARCIIKYIHIAVHCRRYRNFATASQITIALTSPEVRRLTQTWSLVPAADIQALRDLETLISPTRNFYNLRREMEGGAPGAASSDIGCIPFVGIYTHDLLFNAQRPSEIASSPTTPPLVNVERCRIAASIVKTLLRLLEASNAYTFQPIEGLTERCLWMSALSDDEMRKLAESLE